MLVAAAFGLATVPFSAQDNQENVRVFSDRGITLQKPAGAAWKFASKGEIYARCVRVAHSDGLAIEVLAENKADDWGVRALADYAKQELEDIKTCNAWKEIKVTKKQSGVKFPGAGVGTPAAWHVEADVASADDRPYELREWIFLKSEILCLVYVLGPKGECEKHAKDIAAILAGLKVVKPKQVKK
jgi:hypothetical protein